MTPTRRTRTTVAATPPTTQPSSQKKRETEIEAADRIEKKYKERAITPLKAIRAKCVQCQAGKVKEIAKCTSVSCALHPFRMGKHGLHAHRKVIPIKATG